MRGGDDVHLTWGVQAQSNATTHFADPYVHVTHSRSVCVLCTAVPTLHTFCALACLSCSSPSITLFSRNLDSSQWGRSLLSNMDWGRCCGDTHTHTHTHTHTPHNPHVRTSSNLSRKTLNKHTGAQQGAWCAQQAWASRKQAHMCARAGVCVCVCCVVYPTYLYSVSLAHSLTLYETIRTQVVRCLIVSTLVEQAADLVHPRLTHVTLYPGLLDLLVVFPFHEIRLAHSGVLHTHTHTQTHT